MPPSSLLVPEVVAFLDAQTCSAARVASRRSLLALAVGGDCRSLEASPRAPVVEEGQTHPIEPSTQFLLEDGSGAPTCSADVRQKASETREVGDLADSPWCVAPRAEARASDAEGVKATVLYPSDEDGEDDPCCRICRQGTEAGKLYCPCRCAGSIKWIHESCLKVWLRAQDRQPVCELCGHSFAFLPVYAQHAPHTLTVADWASAFLTSAVSVGGRLARIVFATILWGVALPLLTVMGGHAIFSGRARLPPGVMRHVLPFTMNVFLGEVLSLAGIALIYLLSVVRGLVVASAPEGGSAAAGQAAAPTGAEQTTEATAARTAAPLTTQPAPAPALAGSGSAAVAGVAGGDGASAAEGGDEALDPEEDLWNVMGLQGNPLRALICMVTFLCANIVGICLFLAIPFFFGRAALGLLLAFAASEPTRGLPPVEGLLRIVGVRRTVTEAAAGGLSAAGEAGAVASVEPGGLNASVQSTTSAWSYELVPPGNSPLLDLSTLTAGYAALAVSLLILVPSVLLLGSMFGCCSSRGPEVVRASFGAVAQRARRTIADVWLKLQMLAVVVLQLVVVPCYVGHLVVCLLSGPVLHLQPHTRVNMANANMPVTLVMQLFIGYVHLWGVAFLEGCVADIFVPTVLRRASSNFFVGAICSHRRLFGTGAPHGGGLGAPLLAPHAAALKLALVHVAFHTPLAFVLWHLPAKLLDRFLGEALFPVHLVDRASGPTERAPTVASSHADGGMGVVVGQAEGATPDGQPFFAIEMLQLYVLVLQCLRVLDASPGLARLIASGLRRALRFVGFQHLLSGEAPAVSPGEWLLRAPVEDVAIGAWRVTHLASVFGPPPLEGPAAPRGPEPPAAQPLLEVLWRVTLVGAIFLVLCWGVMVLVLSLPLSVGRWLVRYFLATQAKRISDFLPLSLGVVMLSAVTLAVVKVCEAMPAITARAAMVEQRRCVHVLACAVSALALCICVLILIPVGLGTLALRLVLPLKASSVYQVPIVFLVTDCWSVGLVLTKVVWRMVQTDILLHHLHTEFVAARRQVQGSFTIFFFDLHTHRRIWRSLVAPLVEVLVTHLVFPRTVAHSLLWAVVPEERTFMRAAMLTYCYHVILTFRVWYVAVPLVDHWLVGVRQRIFDSKYLVSTELQNYHPLDAPPASPGAGSFLEGRQAIG